MALGGILKIGGYIGAAGLVAVVTGFGVMVYRGFLKNRANQPAESFAATAATPQGAARLYQEAVHRRDIEAMVALRAFAHEADVLLERQGKVGPDWVGIKDSTAAVLEQAFRAQWATPDWPDLRDARTSFGEPLSLGNDVVTMAERIEYPNRAVERSQLYLKKNDGTWKLFVQ
jgi:hypothetical protein